MMGNKIEKSVVKNVKIYKCRNLKKVIDLSRKNVTKISLNKKV